MQSETRKRIGILRGGMGDRYHASLHRGGEIISHIHSHLSDRYKIVDILVDPDGLWHASGLPIRPAELVHRVDLVWNVGHPGLSVVLGDFAIPTIGGGSFASALAQSKVMLREHMKSAQVPVARSMLIPAYQEDMDARPTERSQSFGRGPRERYAIKKAKEVFEKFGSPWIVKSLTPDQNMAMHLAKTFDELVGAIEDGVRHRDSVVVEEFIEGKVASTHSLRSVSRSSKEGDEVYVFPLGHSHRHLSQAQKEELTKLTEILHDHVGAGHYMKSNFIIDKRGKIYLESIESVPDLKPGSHFHQVCEEAGLKVSDMVEKMLNFGV